MKIILSFNKKKMSRACKKNTHKVFRFHNDIPVSCDGDKIPD